MRMGFYLRLAWNGIRKNRRLYTPYLLACTGVVMMHYIIGFLAASPIVAALPGGSTIAAMLRMGGGVLAFFSALFLFYSNAFLIRRRKKEFGLYNILGMGKAQIAHILFWETLLTAALALGLGLPAGVGLSKLFELLMLRMMNGGVSYVFSISVQGMRQTAAVFGGIFLLLFLNSLRQVSLSSPMELLRSESAGEKPPRANWALGLLGLLLLGAAYYLAVTIRDPLTALAVFFGAVAMVIAATYLLFIFGSVVLCRLLQRSSGYYYQARHFVSTASMVYRMKRNGAGLASICILLTMVLVMLSSTAALYIGAEDSLRTRYPRDLSLDVYTEAQNGEEERLTLARMAVDEALASAGVQVTEVMDYRHIGVNGLLRSGVFSAAADSDKTLADLINLYLVPLADYNRDTGRQAVLEDGQVLLYPFRTGYTAETFAIEGGPVWQVREVLSDFMVHDSAAVDVVPSVYLVVPDLPAAAAPLEAALGKTLSVCWTYGFDLDLQPEKQIELYRALKGVLEESGPMAGYDWRLESLEANRGDFYGTYGGLFFLGILLSLVFLAAAVLIIYYKQVSEGYEDQARFGIMRKVGMTARDIRASINSQMRTVFFLPLLMAGIHLCFAFPMVRKLLMLFNLWNTRLLAETSVFCFVVFGLFYCAVYWMTSNAYYTIVSGMHPEDAAV